MYLTNPIQIDIKKPGYFKRQYEFFSNGKLLAGMEFKSAFTSRASFFIGKNQWQIQSVGLWKKHLDIIADQSPFTKLQLDFSWKYKLRFKDSRGNWYLFKRTSVWGSTWAWIDEKGKPYIQMKSKHFSRSSRGYILLFEQGNEEMYLMMLIGWYQLIAYERQAAAAAT
jgi:hypothetical protein